ncbi:MAG TPA: cupin domain-containing protein [Herpetosiphonaceae bacterium]
MRMLDFSADRATTITQFASIGASSVHLGDGEGHAHIYCVRFEAGGAIGPHPTGFGQLFLIVDGAGWVSGPDGVRVAVSAGHAAYFPRGELHAKGSETGMTAIMIQVDTLRPAPAVE